MKIQFCVTVHSFLDAAAVEEVLKDKNIKHTVITDEVQGSRSSPPTQRKRRLEVTKKMVRDVRNHMKNHPNDTDTRIAKAFNSSKSTIGRIRSGQHPLCS